MVISFLSLFLPILSLMQAQSFLGSFLFSSIFLLFYCIFASLITLSNTLTKFLYWALRASLSGLFLNLLYSTSLVLHEFIIALVIQSFLEVLFFFRWLCLVYFEFSMQYCISFIRPFTILFGSLSFLYFS